MYQPQNKPAPRSSAEHNALKVNPIQFSNLPSSFAWEDKVNNEARCIIGVFFTSIIFKNFYFYFLKFFKDIIFSS